MSRTAAGVCPKASSKHVIGLNFTNNTFSVDREDSHTVNPVSSLDRISKETKSIETGESDSSELDQPLVWGLTGSSLSLSGISIGSRNKDIREAAEMAESLTKTERERKIREFEKEFL